MLDIKYIINNKEEVKEVCKRRKMLVDIDLLVKLYQQNLELTKKIELERNLKNNMTKTIAEKKKKGIEVNGKQVAKLQQLTEKINQQTAKLQELKARYTDLLLRVPNILHPDVPAENTTVKEVNTSYTKYDFNPLAHWEIGEKLKLFDFKDGIKLAGERGYFLTGKGAEVVRALRNFILDLHQEYEEVLPPFFVNHKVLQDTGFFPGGETEVYETTDGKVFIGTGEIPLIARHTGKIFNTLPVRMKAWTPCFRREAGKHGIDTRGLFRTHQFEKVELVTITTQERAMHDFEQKVKHIERVMQLLGLRYRVVNLAEDDCAKKEYFAKDIEVWYEAEKKWAELGTIAHCNTYAAKRANLRYIRGKEKKDCVTIYGTGGVPNRLLIAILNNYQKKDQTVELPKPLHKYLPYTRLE